MTAPIPANPLLIMVKGQPLGRVHQFVEFVRARGGTALMAEQEPGPEDPVLGTVRGIVLFGDGSQDEMNWIARMRRATRYLMVPIVFVSAQSMRDSRTRLMTTGISACCDSAASNESILSEVESRCDREPVLIELREGLLKPFVETAVKVTAELIGGPVTPRAEYQKTGYKMFGDISAVIGLFAQAEGSLVMSFPEATARALAQKILAQFTDSPDSDMIRDSMGELANMIAGQVRGALANTPYSFDMSTPTVVSGHGHEIRHKPGSPCLVVAFSCEYGEFAMQLCLSN